MNLSNVRILSAGIGFLLAFTGLVSTAGAQTGDSRPDSYSALTELFTEWREFETPPLRDGAPDYTAERFDSAYPEFEALRDRLAAIDTSTWPVEQQVDWHMVRAEMNGFEFNHKVLKPWVRDPAFYQTIWDHKSDVPAHEGPTHHAILELWTYEFPLSQAEEQRMLSELAVIPPLMQQARQNLTGNARDLWRAGIRNIEGQGDLLDQIREQIASPSEAMTAALDEASAATAELVSWLNEELPSKDGPSGVGRDNYSWLLQQVHYVPMTWMDEVRLLEREVDRSWSSLKLEEHANRKLPPARAADTKEELDALADRKAGEFIRWLIDEDILPEKDYLEPALREHLVEYVPAETRNFFSIGAHIDPTPLYSHFYHWFDLAQMEYEPHPSPIRRGPLLYNIFDSRNEGTATGVEEMFMHAGLYADSPRSRELVWIMLAQRAARGLGSLYAHANEMDMAEASQVHVKWTPRGWMDNEPDLLQFEQHLYLRQPGYGTSYVTGKYLLERLLAHRHRQTENQDYTVKDFFRELNSAGSVPTSLVHWQLTGDDSEIRRIMQNAGNKPF
ncbi:DUF885 family protein [Chromatocurvus halotolerans]|uniref:Uncharacterized protein DUF885 n=1 Tax=Chromatocurvus halotolerans TaxID=1132028 RepID=A0A4R2LCI0_9GAMM|nr:DUF885 family protein [Chromatocurvus halotolerans]TCO77035.1 uncharacterized protein DUF885 [Chromatocurvus halotolerans]